MTFSPSEKFYESGHEGWKDLIVRRCNQKIFEKDEGVIFKKYSNHGKTLVLPLVLLREEAKSHTTNWPSLDPLYLPS